MAESSKARKLATSRPLLPDGKSALGEHDEKILQAQRDCSKSPSLVADLQSSACFRAVFRQKFEGFSRVRDVAQNDCRQRFFVPNLLSQYVDRDCVHVGCRGLKKLADKLIQGQSASNLKDVLISQDDRIRNSFPAFYQVSI